MKSVISALVALTVITAIAAPASALDSKGFYEKQERQAY
jgi:hypothetical protein